jgi:hypothetical protein
MIGASHAAVRSFAAALLAAVALYGCAGVRPYPNTLEKNLRIRTEADSGSIFSSMATAVDIYDVTADCRTEYLGTVDLDSPTVKVGIPPDRLSYLVFVFSRSSFLGSSRSTISHETLLDAHAGSSYDIDVSYAKDIYNVAIRGKEPGTPGAHKIPVRDIGACEALRAASR